MSGSSSANDSATLLVSCPDRPGLVAALAQVLHGHGANILDAAQYTDRVSRHFFQRIHFDLASLHTDRHTLEGAIGEVAERLSMEWRLSYGAKRKRMAIFVSKFDHCLFDLLWRHRAGELPCEIPLIISNHPDLEPLAGQFGIPYEVYPISGETKPAQEISELARLAEVGVDVIVMARYMQVLSAEFIAHYPAHIINIHHSFLPAFMGGKPYHQAYERGVKRIGATAHYATTDLDEGPIIEQDVVQVTHDDTVKDLVRKGRDVERTVLARAVRWHLEDRVLVNGHRTVVFS